MSERHEDFRTASGSKGGGNRLFGTTPEGDEVYLVQIGNGGTTASIMTWGASLQDLRTACVDHSLVLGASELAPYLGPMRYFGAVVGPVANRIANGRMRVAGNEYRLDRNENDATTLHGGSQGFGERNWTLESHDEHTCILSLRHPDGLCGFPGNMDVQVSYSVETSGALCVEIRGKTDKPTYFGPAFHAYWNLDGMADLSNHRLSIMASTYLPVDEKLIPVGEPRPVEDTHFDFRTPHTPDGRLDINFCLSRTQTELRRVCRLETDRLSLEIETTEPGLQVYDGGSLNTAPWSGHLGRIYGTNAGIAIEPQFWPDAPNHDDYPSNLLMPGEEYIQRSCFDIQLINC